MKKANTKNIVAYVNKQLDRMGSDNVAICLPKLNKNNFEALKHHFKSVKHGAFGYIEFQR